MEKQQNAPAQTTPIGPDGRFRPIWQRWFQNVKTKGDETRRRPYKTYTNEGATLTTHDFGKTILFNNGANDISVYLPSVTVKDIWCWINIMRVGTGKIRIYASDSDYLERYGRSLWCIEEKRAAPNLTLQLISETQWAIIAASGIWRIMV